MTRTSRSPRQVNLETIRSHQTVAEQFGTIGELRNGHAATDLRTWLAAA